MVDLIIGQRVHLSTKKGNFDCVILESPSSDIILVKLDSGYNIGIREEDILNVKELKERSLKKDVKEVRSRSDLPRVALVVTGGTISSKLDSRTGGVSWLTDPKELLSFYPELLEVVNVVKVESPFTKASENVDGKDWKVLSESVGKLVDDSNIEGVIVTHGTDFLHYSASALSFALQGLSKPVVFTYSQRSSDRASSDARLNLVCAGEVAKSDIAEVSIVGHGTNEDDYCLILRGNKARKMHSSRRDAFRPINTRAIGKVSENGIEKMDKYNPRSKGKVNLLNNFSDNVALVKLYPGQDPKIIDWHVESGYKGLVIEASGLGHVLTSESKNNWLPSIKKALRRNVIICMVAQTVYGRLDPLVYSVGRDLEKTGVIFLRDMLAETAFVKLSWVLGNGKLKTDVKENMLKNFSGEFNEFLKEDEFLN